VIYSQFLGYFATLSPDGGDTWVPDLIGAAHFETRTRARDVLMWIEQAGVSCGGVLTEHTFPFHDEPVRDADADEHIPTAEEIAARAAAIAEDRRIKRNISEGNAPPRAVLVSAILLALALLFGAAPAEARGHHHFRHHVSHSIDTNNVRPAAWCGWYMRQVKHVADASFNLARNWLHWGHPTAPRPGAVVVWWHHVGELVAHVRGDVWLVHSGNDGHAVRTRARSIAGAIGFRA
jgi:hypothetical protein